MVYTWVSSHVRKTTLTRLQNNLYTIWSKISTEKLIQSAEQKENGNLNSLLINDIEIPFLLTGNKENKT